MKHARKLTSLLLALVMVFALAVTVAADETGSITVDNPITGQTYTAYKIFDVVYDTAKEHYSYTIEGGDSKSPWYDTVSNYATTEANGLKLTKVGDTTSDTYVVTTTDDFSPAAFADTLKKALETVTPTDVHQFTANAEGKQVAGSLPLGYYFVTSSNGALCNLTTTDPSATIYDKNDMHFEKEVDNANVDVGQTVTFTITGKVTDHTWFDKYTYEITDKMSKGLTFDNTSVKVTVGDVEVPSTDNKYTLTEGSSTDEYTFKLSIDVKKFTIGDEIVVKYNATVNENAVATVSTNEAKLTYSNDPTQTDKKAEKPEVVHKVYSAKIVIDKFETDNENKKLPGAEFVLYKEVTPEGSTATTKQYYKQDKTTKAVSWVNTIAEATTVKTGENGETSFDGLANGTYYLVETKAPAGYNQLTDVKTINVNGDDTGAKLTVTEKVANKAGTLLPSTGGMGTTIFYVLGFVLVVGAGVLLVTKKRMSQGEV